MDCSEETQNQWQEQTHGANCREHKAEALKSPLLTVEWHRIRFMPPAMSCDNTQGSSLLTQKPVPNQNPGHWADQIKTAAHLWALEKQALCPTSCCCIKIWGLTPWLSPKPWPHSLHTLSLATRIRCCLVAKLCLTLCDQMDCSMLGSSIHGILQARILEWVGRLSSRGSSPSRGQTHISYVSWVGRWVLFHECHLGNSKAFYPLPNLKPTLRSQTDDMKHVSFTTDTTTWETIVAICGHDGPSDVWSDIGTWAPGPDPPGWIWSFRPGPVCSCKNSARGSRRHGSCVQLIRKE